MLEAAHVAGLPVLTALVAVVALAGLMAMAPEEAPVATAAAVVVAAAPPVALSAQMVREVRGVSAEMALGVPAAVPYLAATQLWAQGVEVEVAA
jgi:hypothetical protein